MNDESKSLVPSTSAELARVDRGNSLVARGLAEVSNDSTGADPADRSFSHDVFKDDKGDTGKLSIAEMANALEQEGVLNVPQGRYAPEYLLERLVEEQLDEEDLIEEKLEEIEATDERKYLESKLQHLRHQRLCLTKARLNLVALLDKPVVVLEVSKQASNCLQSEGIATILDLVMRTPNDLLGVRNFNKACLKEVCEKLARYGVKLRGS